MLDGKAWLSVSALIHLKGVLSGWGQDSVQASQVMNLALWTGVMLEKEEAIPKLFPQSWEHGIVQNLLV